MERLTKENFWNSLMERYPEGVNHFCEWIDKYKQEVEWSNLFGDSIKFHDLPIDMQYGIIARFDSEKHNGKDGADRIRSNIPKEVIGLIDEVHTLILMNKKQINMSEEKSTQDVFQAPVPSITNFRLRLDMFINSIPFIRSSREVSLAHTHLQRAFMWLGKAQGAAGGESPYKESFNHKTPAIEPTADHHQTSLMNALWDLPEYNTHTARVKSLREQISTHLKGFKEFVKTSESAGPDYDMYLKESRLAAEEASMWLGWELASIKKQQEASSGNANMAPHPASNLPL